MINALTIVIIFASVTIREYFAQLIDYRPCDSEAGILPNIQNVGPFDPKYTKYFYRHLNSMKAVDIASADQRPIEYLTQFLPAFQNKLSADMHAMRMELQKLLLKRPKERTATDDEQLYEQWITSRQCLEAFDLLSKDFSSYVLRASAPRDTAAADNCCQYFSRIIEAHESILKEGRKLDLHVRDTIQLHVGSFSLKESRKSLAQAKSIARVTFAAFGFLILSLVTSFFGMNIKELNGDGPQIKWLLVAAVLITALAFICWLLMWRLRSTALCDEFTDIQSGEREIWTFSSGEVSDSHLP